MIGRGKIAGRRFYYALTSSLGLDQGQAHALLGLDCHGRSHHQPPNTNFCRAAAEAVATLMHSRRCSAADGWLLLAGKLQSLANSGRLEEPAERAEITGYEAGLRNKMLFSRLRR